MRAIIIREREAGQRLDKFLGKYMDQAPKSFFYKMFRKKNIMLNGKKPEGSEKLQAGDEIKLFLAEETIENFSSHKAGNTQAEGAHAAADAAVPRSSRPGAVPAPLQVLYEDEDVLFFNKPQGLLSQKAKEDDISAVELLAEHCLKSGRMTEADLRTFQPAVCNRLDRNTSGVVIAGLSVKGLQTMAGLLRGRTVGKYYRCVVAGKMEQPSRLEGYLEKDETANQVTVYETPKEGVVYIATEYRPIKTNGTVTYLEVKLITGKSHQIRAHLASIGHPVIGDRKYGDEQKNRLYRDRYRVKNQLLHAYRVELPESLPQLPNLAGKAITAPLPEVFSQVLKGEKITEGTGRKIVRFAGKEMTWEPGTRGDFGDRPWRNL